LTTHLVIPDAHAHYQHHNQRALLLGRLIASIKPDTVINIGDGADMPSLSGYEKGRKSFQGRTYQADIDAHLDFQERLWDAPRRSHKRLPRSVYLIGNHEQRINKAIDIQPELEGTISLRDLDLEYWYDEVVPYDGGTPGVINIDGISYAHYFSSGVMGRPVGGANPARSLIKTQHASCTSGHLHLLDYAVETNAKKKKIMGLFCGVYQDYRSDWAGVSNDLWWRGVIVKRNVENGSYDPEFISLDTIKKEYS
jgi:hypothetical protein